MFIYPAHHNKTSILIPLIHSMCERKRSFPAHKIKSPSTTSRILYSAQLIPYKLRRAKKKFRNTTLSRKQNAQTPVASPQPLVRLAAFAPATLPRQCERVQFGYGKSTPSVQCGSVAKYYWCAVIRRINETFSMVWCQDFRGTHCTQWGKYDPQIYTQTNSFVGIDLWKLMFLENFGGLLRSSGSLKTQMGGLLYIIPQSPLKTFFLYA